jgi:AmmeMemoRadiSam system protein A
VNVLTSAQRLTLVAVAREAVVARVSGRPAAPWTGGEFPEAAGVFVTVKIGGQLRGCLGKLEGSRGLAADVAACAGDAASRDPRFTPVSIDELDTVSLEVSVLGPFELCDPPGPGCITIGTHGLLVERGRHRGLLLPQVAIEWDWSPQKFLRQTCLKAGLPPDAWQHDTAVYRFTAQVFGDAAD